MGNYTRNMKLVFYISLIVTANCAPQDYSNSIEKLDIDTQETIGDIFGDINDQNGRITVDGYGSGRVSESINTDSETTQNEVVNDVDSYTPDDFVEAEIGDLVDEASTKVDTTFENCSDYTESQVYECVPYYQCHNGTIISD